MVGGVRDRSGEFQAIAERLRNGAVVSSSKLPTHYDKSQFAIVASQIGKDITTTTEKLERLSKRKQALMCASPTHLLK
jgi:hypothetical protein